MKQTTLRVKKKRSRAKRKGPRLDNDFDPAREIARGLVRIAGAALCAFVLRNGTQGPITPDPSARRSRRVVNTAEPASENTP